MLTSTPKTIWITGASSGIGKACADVYADRGYKVILSSRRSSALEDVATELSKSEKESRAAGAKSFQLWINDSLTQIQSSELT